MLQPATRTDKPAARRRTYGLLALALILFTVALALPAPARAVVLISAPPSSVTLGRSITSGVWYQSYSGGPRWAKISILARDRRVLWSRQVTASASWKYYRYRPRRTGVYFLRYKTAAGATSFRIRVRR
jgi:hypothetical protein